MRQNRPALASLIIGLLALLPLALPVARAASTETMFLSGTDKDRTVAWQFFCTGGRRSGKWTTIPVPSNWETKGFGTYTHGWNAAPGEKGLYKYLWTPPARWRGQSIALVFEGSMTDTEVKVNGALAGPIHQGGFYRFKYDVTKLLQLGRPNLLEVTVSKDSADASVNRAERQADYWSLGGIYRPVYLEVRPAQSIERVAINARADGSFASDVFLNNITTADTLTAQVRRLDGAPVGPTLTARVAPGQSKQTLSAKILGARLWSAETPNQYQVEISLKRGRREVHRVSQRFGFRTVEVREGDGIYVNGRKVMLKGVPRHASWPDSGRTTSAAISRADVLLMKGANMNAVLCAHYPPDRHFLDLCDELGLYVLDELAGWQKKYDTGVGSKLVEEMVAFDVNHPSILFWCNANEGGWNTDLDDDFALYDPQQRRILHPWALSGGVQTGHYKTYSSTQRYLNGQDGPNIFMPTEFLHALYDGGGGAGLDDYWSLMMSKPLSAGGFIWVMADEGLVRDDRGGAIDVNGNNYPDGIVGPYREKEGSFFTIKDIWSPLQLSNRAYYEAQFPASFNGQVGIANHYAFINTSQCRFRWKLINFAAPFARQAGHTIAAQGIASSPSIAPGASGFVRLLLPADWRNADALALSATDAAGREVSSWTWPIKKAVDFKNRIVRAAPGAMSATTVATEDAQSITLAAGAVRATISKSNGRLTSVSRNGALVALANGPTLTAATTLTTGNKLTPVATTLASQLQSITHAPSGAAQIVQANFSGNLSTIRWRLHPSGWLQLEYKYNMAGPQDFMGVSFDLPEKAVTGVKWLGQGPYRVWKNRMRGPTTDVWSKSYNDTATGADGWKYPEFKGYHSKTYWAQLQTTTGAVTMVTPDENLFLRLYTPRVGTDPRWATAAFPTGDISFLDGIAPIGNKFHTASDTGPQGAPNVAKGDYEHTIYFFFGEPSAAAGQP